MLLKSLCVFRKCSSTTVVDRGFRREPGASAPGKSANFEGLQGRAFAPFLRQEASTAVVLDHLPVVNHGLPRDAKRVLRKTLPTPNLNYKVVRRQAGMGSLGQQRFVAIASWEGGHIAREAKAILPSACVWLDGHIGSRQS